MRLDTPGASVVRVLLINCKYTNISPKNKFLTLNFSLKVLFYLEFNKLYARWNALFMNNFVISQVKVYFPIKRRN